ncbi:DUF695 domain-containing protein [Moheibacter sediminis]|uniref:DUF695 domain-containing protein n=1 Tax=Moheibacter sediminis TaxID=1434700 RepID=A0A1W1Z2D1_9FLAO|nr:DUF695 domain-containing protein [Moheibacter sediminis]SMC42637.1 Family of unknown function [Moheibacter sediminis]
MNSSNSIINQYNTKFQEFWYWFAENSNSFHQAIKTRELLEENFFDKLTPQLNELCEGIYFLTGMMNEITAELIFTPDGVIKNIAFVEELVNAAPEIPNWKFTALKPETDIENVGIQMDEFTFSSETVSFYPNEHAEYPDEIDITIVHKNFNEENKEVIINGVYIFIDNYLGELNSVTTIDNMTVIGESDATQETISIDKLKDYLIWREKEFLEKYEGTRHNTQEDAYNSLQAELENGMPYIAIVNSTVLQWENKASHPWILSVEIDYEGDESGLPDEFTYDLMNDFEDEILQELTDSEGYLNIGRETAENLREIHFACKEFRKPSQILYNLISKFEGKLNIDFHIYKDKYWQSFQRFDVNESN